VTRLGVVGHPRYERLAEVMRTVSAAAPELGLELAVERELLPFAEGATELDHPADVEAMLTLGGDGTFLRAARFVDGHEIPILGVNLGRLGFLTCCGADELESTLARFARREFVLEKRLALEATVFDDRGTERVSCVALNDVVLHKGGYARVVSLRVSADGETVASYSADGVVISTPTGSTAYNLSAGGPVVFPTLACLIVTPISAHTLAIRPLVLSPDSAVRVQADVGPDALLVTVDGQEGAVFGAGDTLQVRRSENSVSIVRFPGSSFFATMRRKLGWGGLQERDELSEC
jgi:NAD+ kinase